MPTVFIRLTGCPLRCVWCDTEHAFSGGERLSIDEILQQTAQHQARYVCVTGGEPLAQKNCLPLLAMLCNAGYQVSLETSGALDISAVDPRVARIVDLKAPGSGEMSKNFWPNLEQLKASDELKFVLKDRTDYEWAKQMLVELKLNQCCPILYSPVQDSLSPSDLADWILSDHLPVRFQLQLHKQLWGNIRGK